MPMQVFVSVTPELRKFLKECTVDGAEKQAVADSIDLDELYKLADEHHKISGAQVSIPDLLEGAEVVDRRSVPEPPMTELERMRAEAQERQYQRMVDGVTPLAKRKDQGLAAYQGLNWATNFGTQVIVAFIGAFLLGYFFVETFIAPDNSTAKVVAGAFCSFVTLLLETCLLVVHESKEQMIERKKREREAKEKQRKHTSSGDGASADAPVKDESVPEAANAKPSSLSSENCGEKPPSEKKKD